MLFAFMLLGSPRFDILHDISVTFPSTFWSVVSWWVALFAIVYECLEEFFVCSNLCLSPCKEQQCESNLILFSSNKTCEWQT
jgi:hypothetical protein